MSALGGIVRFELGYYFRRISTHVYFVVLFLATFFLTNGAAGGWGSANVGIGGAGGIVHANSPSVLMGIMSVVSLIGVIIVAAVSGNAIYRDFLDNTHPLFFTTPVTKAQYVLGRFLGSLLINAYVHLSLPLGTLIGTILPNVDEKLIGPFRAEYFIQPYVTTVLPNLVITGAIFFCLAAFMRQMLPNYVGAIVLFVGYLTALSLVSDMENLSIAAMVDPFGLLAYSVVTRYWTAAEQNSQVAWFQGLIFWNRLLWLGIAAAVFGIIYRTFKLSHSGPFIGRLPLIGRFFRAAPPPAIAEDGPLSAERLTIPTVRFDHSRLTQFATMCRRACGEIVFNVYFIAIVLSGLFFVFMQSFQIGKIFGTSTYPVTYQVLGAIGGNFALFVLIIITVFAGELIWRERDLKMEQLHDTVALPSWMPFLAKLTTLATVVVLFQVVVMFSGLLLQLSRGYTNFELGLYVKGLFTYQLVDYVLIIILALTVQVLVNHKYVGHFIMITFYVSLGVLPQLGFEHNLYQYGSDSGSTYSDMNQYGPFAWALFWFKVYWSCVALSLAALSNLFWVRSQDTSVRWRLHLAKLRLRRPAALIGSGAVALALVFAGFIFYNTNLLNEYQTTQDGQAEQADYERKYKQHEDLPQPRVTGVSVEVDLYPMRQALDARGTYRMKNKTDSPITTVHVLIPSIADIGVFEFDRPHRHVETDDTHGYHVYELTEPLAPGAELSCRFELAYDAEGFQNSGASTQVVENGTFVNSAVMPSFGYDPSRELFTDDDRRKHGFEPKERMADLDDPEARGDTYISRDSDWVDFEATVSTVPDQIALAPGYLQREWTENGRRYFHYEMDSPILHFYSFLSARYVVERDKWNDVDIEVYYHPGHDYNVQTMIESVKKSLDYFTTNFSPYQHRQVRILEFPRYASFAQSFPNTIPYSEAIGFIAKVDDEEDIDYPFYVTSHEVAHQWFAHQVIGGNVQGSTLLSESLSQYAALMVMEHEFGPEHMRRFLKYELDSYLLGRALEDKKELPLMRVENQQYIHYRKGSVILYAIKDYLGEDVFNGVIRDYLADVAFQEPPYTNAREFVDRIRAVTPEHLAYVIEDMFETITVYDNRVTEATYRKLDDGKYEVTIKATTRKFRADEEGLESEVDMNDLIDVGVFAEGKTRKAHDDVPLFLEKRKVGTGESEFVVIVDEKPSRAGIDPLNKLVDRDGNDNRKRIKLASSSAN